MMNLPTRRPRPGTAQNQELLLAILALAVAGVVSVSQASDELAPSDILVGLLLVVAVRAFKDVTLPNRAAKIAFALVLGHGAYLVVAGLVLTVGWPDPAGPWLTGHLHQLGVYLPGRYWYLAGWAILSVLALPFTPRKERYP